MFYIIYDVVYATTMSPIKRKLLSVGWQAQISSARARGLPNVCCISFWIHHLGSGIKMCDQIGLLSQPSFFSQVLIGNRILWYLCVMYIANDYILLCFSHFVFQHLL